VTLPQLQNWQSVPLPKLWQLRFFSHKEAAWFKGLTKECPQQLAEFVQAACLLLLKGGFHHTRKIVLSTANNEICTG